MQVIERIKHFFNVPNLIFVLLINRKQLELSFTGVYGPIDAHAYLGKFINIYFGLPPVRQTGINLNKIFLRNLAVRYKFGDEAGVGEFIEHFSAIATDMGMSFRDLEKAMTYFTLADTRWRGALLVWPIALKVSKADLFTRLSRKEPLAIDESLQLITALNNGEQHNYYYIPSAITALVNGSATEEQKQYLNRFHFTLDNGLLWAIFKAIDVSIQD